jgi:hypothetical protein
MESTITKNAGKFDDDFDCRAAGVIWCNAHYLMERIRGFMQSH